MIAYLEGTIVRVGDKALIVNTNGVGYQVFVTPTLLHSALVGSPIVLHIHTTMTDSAINLYGFVSSAECHFFEQLISVSGVGSKTALNILSQPIDVVQRAIVTSDIPTLTKLPGIGRKSAERLIIELKDKCTITSTVSQVTVTRMQSDALEALLTLGFPRYEAMEMLSRVPADISDAQEVVQYALKSR